MIQLFYEVDGRPQVYTLLKEEISIGRSSENDVVLNDFSVSRKHAILVRKGETWYARDNKSTNGVRVNGKTVSDMAIKDGDEIGVGTFTLRLRDDPSIVSYPRGPEKKESTSTFIRPLAEFNEDFGLEKDLPPADSTVLRKRGSLDLAYKNKVFEILVQVAKTLISADELESVLEKVMDLIFEYLPVDRGFLLLMDESGELKTRVARLKSSRVAPTPEGEVPFSRSIVEMVVRQKVAYLTSDAQKEARFDLGQSVRIQHIRSAMCVPLWDRGTVIGVIHVDSPIYVGTFKSEDLDLLTALSNFAAVAIERASLHARVEEDKRIRSRLERYHSPAVIEEIIAESSGTGSLKVARTKSVTVLFADLVGFTTLSEKMPPETVSTMLNTFFTFAAEAVFSVDGTLDKFIGDEAMAFFGAPIDQPDHAWRSIVAALKIRESLETWNRQREAAGEKRLDVRIAINSGEVVVGEIGSDRRVDYTVLGTPVNIAARIEQFVAAPGDIVIGPETYEAVKDRVNAAQLGFFALKGLVSQVPLFKILGLAEPAAPTRPTVEAVPPA
ncbi:MAG TPA: adenylate/guanylate cyclase domain-containing protein [Thermoanaerobaculia bacterium]|nr:adenylate/guanylate cyclase domain-containing protein [Thermoanaerobaculia bacterium]